MPHELLTFMFTDLASSTRMWEQNPDAMGMALERHDEILRQAVEGAGGTVVKTTGDGLMATFSAPGDALSASLAVQQGLAGEPWPDTGALEVRIGLHVGEAEPRAGDFYGSAVNRAARIMAAGHGGQILLSGLVAGLVDDRLPSGATLRDLGEHRLKDLSEPEHVFQLEAPGLRAEFPPLLTLSERPNNLPSQPHALLGRDSELAAVTDMLVGPDDRLVTLTGPGGTGKTRLALQVAADTIEAFDDGAFFVDLSEVRTAEAVFETAVRALDVSGLSSDTSLDALVEFLKRRRVLLILDNFEQIADAAAGVATLLAGAPDLKVLVTSREALRVRGERLFPVPPLSLPDRAHPEAAAESEAVRLFVERARAVLPSFELDEDNRDAVIEICIRLDGLPLAIELAVARLRILSPHDLLDRLQSRLDVLRGGARDLPERQQTLRSTIAWSYELLDPDEQTLFRALSVFSSARFESVEEVAGRLTRLNGVDVLDVLSSLVEKSLLRSIDEGGTRRLSMLATIRDYAAEQLEADAELASSVPAAHAEHFTELADSLADRFRAADVGRAMERVEAEIENLLAAWEYWTTARDLGRLHALLDCLWALHHARGWYHGAVRLMEDLLGVIAQYPSTPDLVRDEIALRTSLARAMMTVRGYTAEVDEAYQKALSLSAELGEAPAQFQVLRSLASLYLHRTEFDKALETGWQLMELAESADDDSMRVDAHFVVGSQLAFGGDFEEGISHLDRAIDLFDLRRDRPGRFRLGPSQGVLPYTTSSLLLYGAGFCDRAVERMETGLQLARELDHPITLAFTLYHAGFLAAERYDISGVRERATELLALAEEHDYRIWNALALVLLGAATIADGEAEEGLAEIDRGMAMYELLATPPVFWGPLLVLRAIAFGMAGRLDEGMEVAEEGIRTTESYDPSFSLHARMVKGELLVGAGDAEEAERIFDGVVEAAADEEGARMVALMAATRLTRVRRMMGREPDGSEHLRAVYDLFSEGFDEHALVEARALLESG